MNRPENAVIDAVDDFYRTADRWAHTGASDTEPRGVFAQIVEDALEERDVKIPTKAWSAKWGQGSWQLYSGVKGNGLAASALARSARKVVAEIEKDRDGAIDVYRWYFGPYGA